MARVKIIPPPESVEQRQLAQWLDLRKVLWCHVPNGGKRPGLTAIRLKAEGVKPGVPDILIFTPPPAHPEARGVAIEVKRQGGGVCSMDQRVWHQQLGYVGWKVQVCNGAEKAIAWLLDLGY